MVIRGSFDDCAVSGRFRPRCWKSNERTWPGGWKLALAGYRGNVVGGPFPVAARLDGSIDALREINHG
jgi:hypothetical protein